MHLGDEIFLANNNNTCRNFGLGEGGLSPFVYIFLHTFSFPPLLVLPSFLRRVSIFLYTFLRCEMELEVCFRK